MSQADARGRSRLDLAVYGLVAGLIAAGLVGPPLMGALDARLPVSVAYHVDRAPTDPWGTPWALRDGRPWSLGPDRLADAGRGDDLPVLDERDAWLQLYRHGGEGLFGLAVALAVLWELGRAFAGQLRAPRERLAVEAARAALLALPLAAVAAALLALGARAVPAPAASALLQELRARLLVPLELALFGTVYAATVAVLVGVRLGAADATPSDVEPEARAKTTEGPGR